MAVGSTCVVGLQWGDEAKGKIVDLLCDQHDVVVRYQGGANAGHTVVVGGLTYKLSLVPTGILRPGIDCVVGNGVVIHPPLFSRRSGLSAPRASTSVNGCTFPIEPMSSFLII